MVLDPSKREGFSPADAKFLAIVEEFGWHVMTVAPRQGEDDGNVWAYSTGLFYSFGHPEIILFNLTYETMVSVLNSIGAEIKAGHKFEAGRDYPDILDNYECSFRIVDLSQYEDYMGYSIWFYERSPFPALQFFWPDKAGRFPWDEDCSSTARNAQPLLYLPNRPEPLQ